MQPPLALTKQFKLLCVKLEQTAAMTNADQNCVRQGLAQQLVHRVLQPFVHRRAGLIEKHDLRTIEQHAADRQPLLLTKLAALAEREGKLDRALALYIELSSWESFATESDGRPARPLSAVTTEHKEQP